MLSEMGELLDFMGSDEYIKAVDDKKLKNTYIVIDENHTYQYCGCNESDTHITIHERDEYGTYCTLCGEVKDEN